MQPSTDQKQIIFIRRAKSLSIQKRLRSRLDSLNLGLFIFSFSKQKSTVLTGGFQRDISRSTATQGGGAMGGEASPDRIVSAFATAENKSVKPIVSQHFGESLNNRTSAVNDTQINRHHRSSAQVR
jgi:hypothetical protein